MSLYYKEWYIYRNGKPVKTVVRSYTEQDFDELIAIQAECFPPPFPPDLWWSKEQLINHVTLFPAGALCIEVDGTLAGSVTSLRTSFHPEDTDHSWERATDGGFIRNHDKQGDTLYVVDISVRPSFRKLGLGQWLLFSLYEVVVHLGLSRLLGGGRMPGYHRYADSWSADTYLEKVVEGEVSDPVISFLLRCGRTPVKTVPHYLEDAESLDYGALMEWRNPFADSLHTTIRE